VELQMDNVPVYLMPSLLKMSQKCIVNH